MTFIKAKTIIYIVLLIVYIQSSTAESNSYFSFSILYLLLRLTPPGYSIDMGKG